MAKLGAFGRLLVPVRYRFAVLPFSMLLASAFSLQASANPLGNMIAGQGGAQIAIAASVGAHVGDVGARTNINNSPAGRAGATTAAETTTPQADFGFLPPEINSALRYASAGSDPGLSATLSADEKVEKADINLAEKDVARALAVDASGGFQ